MCVSVLPQNVANDMGLSTQRWERRSGRRTLWGARGNACSFGAFTLTALAVMLGVLDLHAEPARIRLRGATRIEARTMRASGKLVVAGSVLDDTGQPVAKEPVSFSAAWANAAKEPVVFNTRGTTFEGCGDPKGPAARAERDGSLTLESDDLGAFCVRITLPVDRYVAKLSTRASALYDAASTEVSVDLARRTLALAFDPRPRVVSLDESPQTVEALARFEDEGTTSPASGLLLSLQNERGAEVGTGTSNASGRVHFTVDAHALGAPGRGELRLAFVGDADTASAIFAVEIERHAHVDLSLADPAERAPAVPEDGIPIAIRATAAGESAQSGSVEAFVGETLVGAAPVVRGRADVIVTFAAPSASDARVRLRYAPDAPWNESEKDLVVTIPLRAPSAWKNIPLFLAGLFVVLWLAVGRARQARAVRVVKEAAPRVRAPEAAVEVLRPARDRAASFTGTVVDAHDSVAVVGARIAIERAGFEAAEVLASTFARDDGTFELACATAREGDTLIVEAPFHAALRQPIPARGELRIALVLRKRALLDRLVIWARRKGRPYDTKAEPTPAHVRRAAGNNAETARWADAVELAAFGGGAVDAAAEQAIDALKPRPIGENAAQAPGIGDGRPGNPPILPHLDAHPTDLGGDNAATEVDIGTESRGVPPE